MFYLYIDTILYKYKKNISFLVDLKLLELALLWLRVLIISGYTCGNTWVEKWDL